MLQLALKRVNEHDNVLRGTKQDELTVRAELHLLDLGRPVLVINRKDGKGSLLVILRIEQVHLLDGTSTWTAPTRRRLLLLLLRLATTVLEVQAGQNHTCVVKTAGTTFIYSDFALLPLVVPNSRGLIARTRDES